MFFKKIEKSYGRFLESTRPGGNKRLPFAYSGLRNGSDVIIGRKHEENGHTYIFDRVVYQADCQGRGGYCCSEARIEFERHFIVACWKKINKIFGRPFFFFFLVSTRRRVRISGNNNFTGKIKNNNKKKCFFKRHL